METLKITFCELTYQELKTIFGGEERVVFILVNGEYVRTVICS